MSLTRISGWLVGGIIMYPILVLIGLILTAVTLGSFNFLYWSIIPSIIFEQTLESCCTAISENEIYSLIFAFVFWFIVGSLIGGITQLIRSQPLIVINETKEEIEEDKKAIEKGKEKQETQEKKDEKLYENQQKDNLSVDNEIIQNQENTKLDNVQKKSFFKNLFSRKKKKEKKFEELKENQEKKDENPTENPSAQDNIEENEKETDNQVIAKNNNGAQENITKYEKKPKILKKDKVKKRHIIKKSKSKKGK